MREDDTTVAELGRLIGRVERTLETSFGEIRDELTKHSFRLGVLEEAKIRAEERWFAEDRLKAALKQHDAEREDSHHRRLQGWQAYAAVIATGIALLSLVVLAVNSFHLIHP